MHFENLWGLMGLPLAGGAIVLLYILKLKRKDVIVSSTFLWTQVIRDVQANAPFQKLRKNLLLLIQLIVAALIIIAFARPFFYSTAPGGRSIVLVIDSSASMQSTDEKPSRLELAKRKAAEQISKMGPDDLMMILSASSRPVSLTGFTAEKAELRHAIDQIQPHDTPTNMRDALNLAADLVASRSNGAAGEIVLISDGGFEAERATVSDQYTLTNLNLGKAHVSYVPIGTGHNNVGITAIDFRRNLGSGKKSVELLVVTHNFGAEPRKFVEEIYAEKQLIEAHEITLTAGGEDTEPFDIDEPDQPTRIQVKLDIQDDLAADNQATLIVRPRKNLRVLIAGKPNSFLEDALRVDPGVELSRTEQFTSGKGFDVVVFNDQAPTKLPEGNYLFLHCVSDQTPVVTSGNAENVTAADWERQDPVLKYVDFGTELFGSAIKAEPTTWGRQLAVSEAGSLIVAGEKNHMRSVFVGFDLVQTRFMLNVSFPIMISDAVRWIGAGDEDGEGGAVHTGDAITIPAPVGSGRITVTRPDGSKRDAVTGERGGAIFTETDLTGIYTVSGVGVNYQFAANLCNSAESDTMPHRSLTVTDNPAAVASHSVKSRLSLTSFFALLGLLVLCVEWWVFHRRPFVS